MVYSHSPARVTPPLIVTLELLSSPQLRATFSSVIYLFIIMQPLPVSSFEQKLIHVVKI